MQNSKDELMFFSAEYTIMRTRTTYSSGIQLTEEGNFPLKCTDFLVFYGVLGSFLYNSCKYFTDLFYYSIWE